MGRKKHQHALAAVAPPLKLDFGCGISKREGFEGVDQYPLVGVDHVLDLRVTPWKWADGSVAEAHASHFIEHLTQAERCAFFNELWRVLAPGATVYVQVPAWSSARAYGDPTHKWPPISEWFWLYLNKEWRMAQAPHADASINPGGYSCDFNFASGHVMHGDLLTRNQEYQQFALTFYKEAAQDIVATLTKKG